MSFNKIPVEARRKALDAVSAEISRINREILGNPTYNEDPDLRTAEFFDRYNELDSFRKDLKSTLFDERPQIDGDKYILLPRDSELEKLNQSANGLEVPLYLRGSAFKHYELEFRVVDKRVMFFNVNAI